MQNEKSVRAFVRNSVIALTLGIAAIATWHFTGSTTPSLEAASLAHPNA